MAAPARAGALAALRKSLLLAILCGICAAPFLTRRSPASVYSPVIKYMDEKL